MPMPQEGGDASAPPGCCACGPEVVYAVVAATSIARGRGGAPAAPVSSGGGNRGGIDGASLLRAAADSVSPQVQGGGGLVQSWGQAPDRLVWTVPRYLGAADPALYAIGLTFMRRTFGLCVACFGLTCCMTGGLLLLWGNGLEHTVFDDVCTHYTNWSCTQWAVDGVLVLLIIPIKFCWGMFHGFTIPMLVLLAIFQSANLALIGCYTRSTAPLAIQTFVTFWVALVTVWVTCWVRERRLDATLRKAADAARSSDQEAGAETMRSVTSGQRVEGEDGMRCAACYCDNWVGTNGRWEGWGDGWARLALYGAISVIVCNFLLMLLKLWLDEPSTFAKEEGSGSDAVETWPDKPAHLDPDDETDEMFKGEGNLRLIELLMGAPGLSLSEKLFDNGKVFLVALLLHLFTVLEAKGAAKFCSPEEHLLAALFICPPGIPQILGCVKKRSYRIVDASEVPLNQHQ